jgi:hypothetical protein
MLSSHFHNIALKKLLMSLLEHDNQPSTLRLSYLGTSLDVAKLCQELNDNTLEGVSASELSLTCKEL